jgi:hypothetical protein
MCAISLPPAIAPRPGIGSRNQMPICGLPTTAHKQGALQAGTRSGVTEFLRAVLVRNQFDCLITWSRGTRPRYDLGTLTLDRPRTAGATDHVGKYVTLVE